MSANGITGMLFIVMSPLCNCVCKQFEVCWIITNICGGASYHTQGVIEVGGVLPLISLMTSAHVRVQEQVHVHVVSMISLFWNVC